MPDLPDDLEHDHIGNYELADDDPRVLAMAKRSRPPVVTLTVWYPADKPPKHDRIVVTDIGAARYRKGYRVPGEAFEWFDHDAGMADWPMDPRPSVWCDPSPPGDDALRPDDLEDIETVARGADSEATFDAVLARLRRAIEEAER